MGWSKANPLCTPQGGEEGKSVASPPWAWWEDRHIQAGSSSQQDWLRTEWIQWNGRYMDAIKLLQRRNSQGRFKDMKNKHFYALHNHGDWTVSILAHLFSSSVDLSFYVYGFCCDFLHFYHLCSRCLSPSTFCCLAWIFQNNFETPLWHIFIWKECLI